MKKPILSILTVLLACKLCFAGTYSGGTGEPNDPYLIATAEDLNNIANHPNDFDKHFKMIADINLADYTGTRFNIIGFCHCHESHVISFRGFFDGNGHKVSNFTYKGSSKCGIGLFGAVAGENTVIKNLGIVNPDIDAGTGDRVGALIGILSSSWGPLYGTVSNCYVEGGKIRGDNFVGGLVGSSGFKTKIDKCYSTTDVEGNDYIGGLVGAAGERASVSDCWTSGKVIGHNYVGGLAGHGFSHDFFSCFSDGSVLGDMGVGGLIGYAQGGTIENCYSRSRTQGYDFVGGLLGQTNLEWERITIGHCYVAGPVVGITGVGALVGYEGDGQYEYPGTVRWHGKSFYDANLTPDLEGVGNYTCPFVEGKTTSEMKMQSTFTNAGWDFVGEIVNGANDIWTTCNSIGYPKFWWQCSEPPIEVEVNFRPRVINLANRGRFIFCYIRLPKGYDVIEIEPESILLEDQFEPASVRINQEEQIAMARFNRTELQDILDTGWVELLINGELTDGTIFEGADTIRVIRKGKK